MCVGSGLQPDMLLVAIAGAPVSLERQLQEQRQDAFDELMTQVRSCRPLAMEFASEPLEQLSLALPEDER
eukprot:COSAG05_NODE_14893_length_384_cov_0.543860_1_plen_70_part_00